MAPTVFALVDRAVARRPDVAAQLAGRAVLLDLGYAPVRIGFDGAGNVVVADDDGAPADAVISGELPDLTALLSAPLTGGVPNPARAKGRAALARLADGRVAVDGSKAVARRFLRLLAI